MKILSHFLSCPFLAYGYANTAAVKPSYVGGTTVYQKPQTYVAAAPASSTFTGYTVQRSNTGGPSYNNTSSYQKPKVSAVTLFSILLVFTKGGKKMELMD